MLLRLLPLFGLLLLGLPLMELATSVWLAQYIGWWLVFWLFASALIGIGILKSWRFATAWALVDSLRSGEVPLGRLFWVARTLVAALLFIFPGPVSDVFGLLLILPWPGGRTIRFDTAAPGFGRQPAANEGAFEGEYSRVDESAPALPSKDITPR